MLDTFRPLLLGDAGVVGVRPRLPVDVGGEAGGPQAAADLAPRP